MSFDLGFKERREENTSSAESPTSPPWVLCGTFFNFLTKLKNAPGEIRTPDLLVRSQTLYPTKLRVHKTAIYIKQAIPKGYEPIRMQSSKYSLCAVSRLINASHYKSRCSQTLYPTKLRVHKTAMYTNKPSPKARTNKEASQNLFASQKTTSACKLALNC